MSEKNELTKEERRQITNKIYYFKRTNNNKKYIELIKKYRGYEEEENNNNITINKLNNLGKKHILLLNDTLNNFINNKIMMNKNDIDLILDISI